MITATPDNKISNLEEQNNWLLAELALAQAKEIKLIAANESVITANNNLKIELNNLQQQLQLLKQAIFGKRSEKIASLNVDQLSMLFNEAEYISDKASDTLEEGEDETLVTKKKKGRKPLSKDIPRERIIHELPESELACACGGRLEHIGEETSEELHHIPATLVVREHVRYKYACKCCQETIKRAPPPFRVLDKCLASSGMLADVLVKKYEDHLPLYRQSQIWQRQDIDLSRSTLSNWVLGCAEKLKPLIEIFKAEIVTSNYVCSDETPINVLSNTAKSYMWVHMIGHRERRAIIFEYEPNRRGSNADEFLKDFAGYHQCDAYSGYLKLHEKEQVIGVGCAAHARRKFMEIIKSVKTEGFSHKAVALFNKLYAIEKKIYWHPPDIIKAERQKHAAPILEDLYELLNYHKDLTPPQGVLSKAINYTLNQWENLTRYLENGMLRIDNNDTEQIIRPFAIGRSNWMFCNSESGANASSIIYSVIATCKANKVNSYNYLKYVLENIYLAVTEEDLRALLPYNIDQDMLKNFRRI